MQYTDPVTGRVRRQSSRTNVRRDAELLAGKWEAGIYAGSDWGLGRMDWNEFRDRFRAEYLESLAPKSLEKADSVLDSFEDKIQPQRLRDVKESTLSEYQKKLRRLGRRAATIKGHLAYIRSALSWALRNKLIDKMPSFPKTARAKKMDVMKGRPITLEEFERMLASVGRVILTPPKQKRQGPATGHGENPIMAKPANWALAFRSSTG